MNPEFLAPEDIAAYLRVSIHTVRAWRKRGQFPPAHKFGRLVRWERAVIERWAADRREAALSRQRIAVQLAQAPSAFRRS